MALDFLATNNFLIADRKQRLQFLQKFETLLGYRLVVLDAATDEFLYGIETLERMAAQ